jgi:hypothetical protein
MRAVANPCWDSLGPAQRLCPDLQYASRGFPLETLRQVSVAGAARQGRIARRNSVDVLNKLKRVEPFDVVPLDSANDPKLIYYYYDEPPAVLPR